MNKLLREFFSAPFQLILIISFSFIAAITIAIGAWVIIYTINDYLSEAMNERVARDMKLAQAFYELKLSEIEAIAIRLADNPLIVENVLRSSPGKEDSRSAIIDQITYTLTKSPLGGNHLIAITNDQAELLAGYTLTASGQTAILNTARNLATLELIPQVLATGEPIIATEIIPKEFLAQVGLAEQAQITILETPRALPSVFDIREGSAGLALISIYPIEDEKGATIGTVTAMHLLNNDFTLVDRIKKVAGIDTVTIFLGDLRISTNVLTQEGKRAIGTRISEEVGQVVLYQGQEYIGSAFVVKENYITRYDPLKNHTGQVVGVIYVGVRQASFQRLVNVINQRILLVAIGTILLTIILTTPVSRAITRPLKSLKTLAEASRKVAEGDMSVRVPVQAAGEVGLLESSFNTMLDTLQVTQEQLIQSEKLASLGQLAAGVAHQLNNPLGTILLYADILQKEQDPASPIRADLDIIVSETKRCKGIVSALLEFARQNQIVVQPTDLNALIKNILDVEKRRYQGPPIDFQFQPDPNLPIVQVDPTQIHGVISNLISNGIEAMPEGGVLTIRTRNSPPKMVTVEIEDTGVGIPPENLSKLFTPFFTTKPVGIGTGLGLAIVYGIIKLHRGQINVRSEVNKGTVFAIQLPIKTQQSAPTNQYTRGVIGNGDHK